MRSRAKNPHDSHRFRDWLVNSAADFRAAHILQNDEKCYKLCAFHLQQCIEKALKAYILIYEGRLLDGHNLTWLCRQAVKNDEEFAQWLDESISLNKYYIETRYPSDTRIKVTKDELDRLMNMTENMFEYICNDMEIREEELI